MSPGPCSLPEGNKSLWNKHNQMVCDFHEKCWPESPKYLDKDGSPIKNHRFITLREWLIKRHKHHTGKTQASSGR